MTDRSIFIQSCTGEKHTHQCMDKDDENAKNLKMCFTAFYCCQNCLVFIKKKKFFALFLGQPFLLNCAQFCDPHGRKSLDLGVFRCFLSSWDQTSDGLETGRLRFQFYHAMNWTLLWSESPVQSKLASLCLQDGGGWIWLAHVFLHEMGLLLEKCHLKATFGSSLSLLILCGLQ